MMVVLRMAIERISKRHSCLGESTTVLSILGSRIYIYIYICTVTQWGHHAVLLIQHAQHLVCELTNSFQEVDT